MSSPAAACSAKPAINVRPRIVSVGGRPVPRDAIAQEAQNHPANSPFEAWMSAARALVIRELLLQEAQHLGISAAPLEDDEGRRETDDEALVRMVVEREVVTPEPDLETCRRYYDNNRRRFRSPDLHEVSHILLTAAPGDQAARAAGRQRAAELIAELERNPSAFAALAQEYSACPSKTVGGNLGQISPGQTVPEFEQALPAIPASEHHAAAVESRYGIHIVRVNRHEPGRDLPFEMVQPRIAAYLAEHVRRTALRQYISLLAGRYPVVGVDLGATDSPLMQ